MRPCGASVDGLIAFGLASAITLLWGTDVMRAECLLLACLLTQIDSGVSATPRASSILQKLLDYVSQDRSDDCSAGLRRETPCVDLQILRNTLCGRKVNRRTRARTSTKMQ
jgi:hypothetical protein